MVNSVKKDLIPALKIVPKMMVAQVLTDCRSHELLQDVVQVVDFERRIDQANRMNTNWKGVLALRGVCKDLVATKNYTRAKEVAASMSNLCDRGGVLKDISLALIADGKIEDAMDVVGDIVSCVRLLGVTDFLDIIKALRVKGESARIEMVLDQAKQVADQTSNDADRSAAFRSICLALTINENFDEAIDLACRISEENAEQEVALYVICRALTKAGRFEEAIFIANKLTLNKINEFMHIARCLVTKKQVQRALSLLNQALELIDQIPNIDRQEALFRFISVDFVLAGRLDQALIIAGRIGNNRTMVDAFTGMALALIEKGELDQAEKMLGQAAQVALQIAHPEMQQAALRSISSCLVKACRFDKAICVAESTNNEQMGGLALYDVVKALVKKGDLERATAVAHNIVNNQGQRDLALEFIGQFSKQDPKR